MIGPAEEENAINQGFERPSAWFVVPSSYSCLPGELVAFFHSGFAPFIDVGRQIHQMNASLSFLACLNAYDRQGKIAAERFAQKFIDREMSKEITANLVNRHNGFAIILCHQEIERRSAMKTV
jgi:hypothetical protein